MQKATLYAAQIVMSDLEQLETEVCAGHANLAVARARRIRATSPQELCALCI